MSVSLTAMPEVIEKVTATRVVFESALQEYLDACSALRDSSIARALPRTQLGAFTLAELACFTSHETKLHKAKSLVGSSNNLSRSVHFLPPEILSRIFELIPSERHANSENYFLFPKRLECLSRVCSHWRQVTLGAPSLWSSICLAPRNAANTRLLSRARVYATRANGLPLQIHIAEYKRVEILPDGSRLPDTDGDLLRFVASVSHRISSIELVAPLRVSGFYTGLLGICLAGTVPGIFTQLNINNMAEPWSQELSLVGSVEELSQTENLALDVPVQHLEDILGSVTSISLRDARPSWTSKAFHGLIELQLFPGTNFSGFLIDESDLCQVLSTSPGLRVLVFGMSIRARRSRGNPATPIKLKDLEVLDLVPSHHSYVETILQIVAPGSRLSLVRINIDSLTAHDSHLDSAIYRFFSHTTPPRLGFSRIRSLAWLKTIYYSTSQRLSTLAIDRLILTDISDVPVVQRANAPALLYGADHLHLSNSQVSLHQLCWILEIYCVHTLTLWQCHVCSDSGTRIENDGLALVLSQKCAVVNILEHEEPGLLGIDPDLLEPT